MRLRLRLIWLLISSLWRGRLSLLDESVLNFTVLPNDIDVLKITNDRYLAIMDLGRIDLALRTGLIKAAIRRGWGPVVTFITIRFRYPLKAFQKCQLHSKAIYWDEDTFYFQQQFIRNGRVVATAYASATLLNSHGAVPSRELLTAMKDHSIKPNEPKIVEELRALNTRIHDEQHNAK